MVVKEPVAGLLGVYNGQIGERGIDVRHIYVIGLPRRSPATQNIAYNFHLQAVYIRLGPAAGYGVRAGCPYVKSRRTDGSCLSCAVDDRCHGYRIHSTPVSIGSGLKIDTHNYLTGTGNVCLG